ncbi:MAG: hypothetical protein ACKOX6_04200 [Bdellovibrio sp.]
MKIAIKTIMVTGLFFGLLGQAQAAKNVTCQASFRSANPQSPDVRILDWFRYSPGQHVPDSSSPPVMPRLSISTPIYSEADLLRLNAEDWDKMIALDEVFQETVAKYFRDDTIFQRYADADHAKILEAYRCFRDRAAGVSSGGGKVSTNAGSSRGNSGAGNTSSHSGGSTSSIPSTNNRTPKKNYQSDPAYKAAVAKQCPWTVVFQGQSYGVTSMFPNYTAGYTLQIHWQRFEMPQLSVRTPITSQDQLNQLTTQDWAKLEKAYTDLNLALVSPEQARQMDSPTRREVFACYTNRAKAVESAKYGDVGSSSSASGSSGDSGRAPYLSGKCVKFSNAGAGVSDDYKRISNLCNKKIAVAYCEYLGSDMKRCQTDSDDAWSTSGTMRAGGSTMFSARFGASRNQRVSYYVCDMTNAAKLCLPPNGRSDKSVNDGSIGD